MAATGKPWLAATDDFYLSQRMQRWAGVTDTAVCLDRSVVNPMLDDRFIAIARGMAPESKRGSLFLAGCRWRSTPTWAGCRSTAVRPRGLRHPGVVNRARAVQPSPRRRSRRPGSDWGSRRVRRQARPCWPRRWCGSGAAIRGCSTARGSTVSSTRRGSTRWSPGRRPGPEQRCLRAQRRESPDPRRTPDAE